jgi:hypothetical protein
MTYQDYGYVRVLSYPGAGTTAYSSTGEAYSDPTEAQIRQVYKRYLLWALEGQEEILFDLVPKNHGRGVSIGGSGAYLDPEILAYLDSLLEKDL